MVVMLVDDSFELADEVVVGRFVDDVYDFSNPLLFKF